MKFVAQQFYMVESWALLLLGVLHSGATFRIHNAYTNQAHWFLSAGLLMVLVAALNLLNRTYGGNAPRLRWVCMGANVMITAFSIAGGIVGRAGVMGWIVVLAIVVPLTALSFSRIVNR